MWVISRVSVFICMRMKSIGYAVNNVDIVVIRYLIQGNGMEIKEKGTSVYSDEVFGH